MGDPNNPFPVPPEGVLPQGQPPTASHPPQPPHGAPPPQPPYGASPYQPPYGGPPQPTYGAAAAGNSKLLIGVIAGLVLVIAVGATLVLSGALDGKTSTSSISNSSANYTQEDLDMIAGQGKYAPSSGNSAGYASPSGSSAGSGDLAERVGDVVAAMHAQTPAQAGPLTIRNVRQVGGTTLEINAEIPRSMSPSEFPFLENDLRPNICGSPAGALAREGATVMLYITETGGYRHPMRVSC